VHSSAEHDPILWAGAIRCLVCRRAAFPTDAGTLGGGWIIATYPRPCEHDAGGTILIDLRGVEMSAATRPTPLYELARYVPGRRCAGHNKKGRPCRSYASPGSDYCHAHHAAGKPA
jgi:hypothetical protein